MAWTKQFGGGSRMNKSYTFMANGFALNPISTKEMALSWAEELSKELNIKIINLYYEKNKIFVIFQYGHFSLKFVEKHSIEAEFEMVSEHAINIDYILKNLEEKILVVDPCHLLISKNFNFTIEKAEGLHLKNEAVVWINQ